MLNIKKGFGEDQRLVAELGIPYSLSTPPGQNPRLLVGPYVRPEETSRTRDFYGRIITIPVDRIVNFRRIRLNDQESVDHLRK